MSVFTFTDDLAVLGTNVEEISQLVNVEELWIIKIARVESWRNYQVLRTRPCFLFYDEVLLHDGRRTSQPGTMTALVGPSGSGKNLNTAKLIAGYWDVTSGSITLGVLRTEAIPAV